MTTPILLYGPTASGKSAIAAELARRVGGMVINADALQVYDGWRVLTARPEPEAEAALPHRLYGHVDWGRADYSVGRWLGEAAASLAEAAGAGLTPIIVGGTGLYFTALTQGLAPIPPIPAAIHDAVDAQIQAQGVAAAAAELAAADPETAAAIDRANPRRVARALEVLRATGKGMRAWAAETPAPLIAPGGAIAVRLTPDPAWLRPRVEARLERMAAGGALVEASAALSAGLEPSLPAMKALGAADFMAHLRGEITLPGAIAAASVATLQYAKRQRTWGRNQLGAWTALDPADPAAAIDAVLALSAPQ